MGAGNGDRIGQAPGRSRHDALFGDPRHFRGDCRLVRTAIRCGWLAVEDWPAVKARLRRALEEREAMGFASDSARARAMLAWAEATFGVFKVESNLVIRALRYGALDDRWDGQWRGRPKGRRRR